MNKTKDYIKSFLPETLIKKYKTYKSNQIKRREEELYQGSEVVCSICNSSYRVFASYPSGLGKRENARCINCGSLERHRLLWKFLNEQTELFSARPIKLLHFAPEKFFYDVFLNNPVIDYYPCDLFPKTYHHGGMSSVIKVDITDIPFSNDYFDVILCNQVLEHVPDDLKAMSELFRVMRTKGGWGIFMVPINYYNFPSGYTGEKTYEDFSIVSPKEREKAFGQFDHVRIYGRDYKDRLANAGFMVYEEEYAKNFTTDKIFKFGFKSDELIYLLKKGSPNQK